MQAKTVLIVGARGRFGLCAARAFAQAGWQVLAQARATAGENIEGVRWLHTDIGDTDALAQQAAQASVLVHAINPGYKVATWEREALAHLRSSLALAKRLQATLMFPGNVYAFGEGMPAVLTEETPTQPSNAFARIRADMEHELAQAAQITTQLKAPKRDSTPALRSIVIRAGNFFGSGTGSWFDLAMVKDIRKGVFCFPGPMDVATPWAYLPDLAQSFVQVAERSQQLPAHAVFHFAGHTLSGHDWERAVQQTVATKGWLDADQALRVTSMPWGVMRALAWAVPTWRAVLSQRYLWQRPHRLDGSKLQRLIGQEPHTDLGQALATTLGV